MQSRLHNDESRTSNNTFFDPLNNELCCNLILNDIRTIVNLRSTRMKFMDKKILIIQCSRCKVFYHVHWQKPFYFFYCKISCDIEEYKKLGGFL